MPETTPLSNSPRLQTFRNMNHVAFRCRDAEQTRWFYEDVLGLPLATAFVLEEIPGLEEPTPFMHLFFQMGNGDYIAFFDEPHAATPEQFAHAHSFDRHIAFEVPTENDLLAWQAAINEKGVSCLGPVDHGFVKSVYMYDPNGLQVEVTCQTAAHDQIMRDEKEIAHEQIKKWVARTRDLKIKKFGREAVEMRSRRVGRK